MRREDFNTAASIVKELNIIEQKIYNIKMMSCDVVINGVYQQTDYPELTEEVKSVCLKFFYEKKDTLEGILEKI